MIKLEPKSFTIPTLQGISQRTIDNHLALYKGYVEEANEILEDLSELNDKSEVDDYSHLLRDFGFEFNGIRNHEVYFGLLEGGPKELAPESELEKAMEAQGCDFACCIDELKTIALTRGVGWVMLSYDPISKKILKSWVDEQHIGQLAQCTPILAIDMWEHAYLMDYDSADKKQYIQNFFANINWQKVEENFKEASK